MRIEPIGQCHNVNGIKSDEFSGSTAAGARKSEVWINGGRAMIHRIKEADDNAISIDYTGSLFYSPEVNGEYRIVENAYSPYAVQRMGLKGFYLVR